MEGNDQKGQIAIPVSLVSFDIGSDHGEEGTIVPFNLAVGRRVVGCSSGLGDLKLFTKSPEQVTFKVCALIRMYLQG